ncbi:MAG: zinc-finger domain-containing protein [Alphaproteobacteria bacterium]|nr:zinc-finger domain-containing protein [Alphaproteobacteria bacterium]
MSASPQPTPLETVTVDTPKVSCDGDAASEHPRVFLTMGPRGYVDCPYCSKRFVLQEGTHGGGGH